MEFRKKMNQRLIIAIAYILLGVALICIDLANASENYFYISFGLALLLMGVLRLFRYRKIIETDQTMRKQELAEKDERTLMMAERARSWSFSLSLTAAGIWVITLNLLGRQEEALPFAWYVCGMVVLYWICFSIIRKKY